MSGNILTRTEVIPASGVVNLPNANFLFVITSSAAVTFDMFRTGLARGSNRETYSGITSGLQIGRTQRWDYCNVTGTAGVSVTFMYGYTDIREDVTLFNQQIAVISGVTKISETPSALQTDTADTAQASTTQTVIPQNLLRQRILIGNLSTSLNSIRVSHTGGAARGVEIQPGQNQIFRTTDTLTVRNDNTNGSGGAATWFAEEE